MRIDLPLSFYSQFAAQATEAVRVGPAEWAASCPWCGGRDRFHMWAKTADGNERYWCRRCDRKGWMDGRKLTAEEKERLRQERLERQRLEALERQRRTQQLTEAAYWRGYHDAMRDVARQEWRKRGIEEKVQDWFLLGYAMKEQHPSLTIPFHNREWAVETLQYRLLDVDGRGKYRFESGYPATAFYCDTPGDYPFIIVEGAIKAMVLWWRMVVERDRRYNVVAVPSKTPGRVVVERLAEEIGDSRVYLMLDPDASGEEQMRIGSGFTDCRYVAMPFKVDDAINEGYDPLSIERLFIKSATVEPL